MSEAGGVSITESDERTRSRIAVRAPRRRQQSTSFRRRLLLLAAALTLPTLALAAGGFYSAYVTQRRATETLLTRTTRALALGVDRDLAVVEASLKAVAPTGPLSADELRTYQALIARAAPLAGAWLVLSDATGTPLVSSRQVAGEPLPRELSPTEAAALAQAGVTDIALDRQPAPDGPWFVKIRLPVIVGGRLAYVLTAIIPPQAFERLMGEQGIYQTNWVAAVLDEQGRVVLRSRGTDSFIGQPAAAPLLSAITKAPEGAVTSETLDGLPVRSFYSRAPRYGWYFVVGYPLSELSGSLLRSLAWFAGIAAAIALGLGYAVLQLRSLLRSVRRLHRTAGALGGGATAPLLPTGVLEFDAVQNAFAETAAQLTARNAERGRVLKLLRENEQRLEFALEAGGLGTWAFDPRHGVLTSSDRARSLLGLPLGTGLTFAELSGSIHPDDRENLQATIERAMATGRSFALEARAQWTDRSVHWIDIRGLPVHRADMPPLLIGMVQDITERKTAENRQRLLLRELNHRVKNSLATVQSIALLTRRSHEVSDDAWEAFEHRLVGLAKTHDLLTAESWNGASLASVFASELDPYQDAERRRIALDGPPVRLNARATLTLGLCIHELATNAAKYGALSVATGRVHVSWQATDGDPNKLLLVRWEESCGPPVTQPTRQGFGSKLLERGLRRELAAEIALDYAPEGLRCTISLPLDRIVAQPAPDVTPQA